MTGSFPSKRVTANLIGLYVAQAIPVYLFAAALPAIFRANGIDLATIGSMSLLLLPWILKFLWAPYVDRFQPKFLGSRRGWIIPLQSCMICLLILLSFFPPEEGVGNIFWLAMTMALLSATQDIATDGYAVEHLSPDQRAVGNAIQGGSVAAGVILGGSVTLLLYDWLGWQGAILVAAAGAALALMPVLVTSERIGRVEMPEDAAFQPKRKPSLLAFLKRPGAVDILIFALVFRCSEGLVKAMEQPFLIDKGISLSTVGLLSGGSAAAVGLAGSALAALAIRKFGLHKCLWSIGLSRTLCFALFALAANMETPPILFLMGLAAFNTILRYMELVALYSYFMRHSSLKQAATDFTFLSCAQLFVYMLGGMVSGRMADMWGYETLFLVATLLSLVGIIYAMRRAGHAELRLAAA